MEAIQANQGSWIQQMKAMPLCIDRSIKEFGYWLLAVVTLSVSYLVDKINERPVLDRAKILPIDGRSYGICEVEVDEIEDESLGIVYKARQKEQTSEDWIKNFYIRKLQELQ
ncbi:MAG: hypothetical protein S4CHLAM20_09340 [Chlamydiia bacterium]|nr:hypothetical protein [Chlamydiia bacterium]